MNISKILYIGNTPQISLTSNKSVQFNFAYSDGPGTYNVKFSLSAENNLIITDFNLTVINTEPYFIKNLTN
jgi:hypothetical protein